MKNENDYTIMVFLPNDLDPVDLDESQHLHTPSGEAVAYPADTAFVRFEDGKGEVVTAEDAAHHNYDAAKVLDLFLDLLPCAVGTFGMTPEQAAFIIDELLHEPGPDSTVTVTCPDGEMIVIGFQNFAAALYHLCERMQARWS